MFSGGELSCRDSGQMSRRKNRRASSAKISARRPPFAIRSPARSRAVRAHTNRALLKGTERTGSLGCLKA